MFPSRQIEYSRLNISDTILSKRHLRKLVEDGIVDGWDDPRMPTIKGIKRKGYTPNAINNFCKEVGLNIGGSSGIVDYGRLENCLRKDLNENAKRLMGVVDPIKITILNLDADDVTITAPDFPINSNSTTHSIKFGRTVYINKSDFRLNANRKYFRLAPGRVVRLKYADPIRYVDVLYKSEEENIDNIDTIYVEYIPDYDRARDGRIKGTITWVRDLTNSVTVKKYGPLFKSIKPIVINENSKKKYVIVINENSKKKYVMYMDQSISNYNIYDKMQIERVGYFSVDPDSMPDNIIINHTVSLRESKDKKIVG